MKQRGGLFGLFKSKEDQLKDAIYKDDYAKATELINKGADVNKLLPGGNSVLFQVIKDGYNNKDPALNFIKLVLDKGANVNLKLNSGTTALSFAIQQYTIKKEFYHEVIKLLCSKGVDKTGAIDKAIQAGVGIELEVLLTNNCGQPDSMHPRLTNANITRRTAEYAANAAKSQEEWKKHMQRKQNIYAARPSYNRYAGGSRRKSKGKGKKTIKKRKA